MTSFDVISSWKSISGYGSVWLLNYLIHSTVLLGAVWMLVRFRQPPQAFRDILWKIALVGGVATATFQITGWGGQSLGGSWTLPTGQEVVARGVEAPDSGTSKTFATPTAVSSFPAGELWQRVRTGAVHGWPQFLMGIWGIGAVLCGARLFLARIRLYRGLHPRSEIHEGPARDLLDHLCRAENVQRRIRLTASPRIGGPVALGRGEICLPLRALRDLDREQLYHVLAHELAHLLRGDPIWRWVSAGVEGTFFFQPLNRMARRHLNETAEFLCDDWTVERTGEGVTLAKCLVEVAAWLRPFSKIPAAGMAERGSTLVQRVERLLSGGSSRGGHPRWAVLGSVVFLGVLVTVSPGFVPYSTTPPLVPSPMVDEMKKTDHLDPVLHLNHPDRVLRVAPLDRSVTRYHRKIRTIRRKKQEAVKAIFLELKESRFRIEVAPPVLHQLEQLNLHLDGEGAPLSLRIQELEDRRRLIEEATEVIRDLIRRQQEQEHRIHVYRI